jgi:hypothetical protein
MSVDPINTIAVPGLLVWKWFIWCLGGEGYLLTVSEVLRQQPTQCERTGGKATSSFIRGDKYVFQLSEHSGRLQTSLGKASFVLHTTQTSAISRCGFNVARLLFQTQTHQGCEYLLYWAFQNMVSKIKFKNQPHCLPAAWPWVITDIVLSFRVVEDQYQVIRMVPGTYNNKNLTIC